MFSVAPNIVLVPNMTQNAERKHRTQDTNTAPIRPRVGGLAIKNHQQKSYHQWHCFKSNPTKFPKLENLRL